MDRSSSRVRAGEFHGVGWFSTDGRDLSMRDLRGKIVVLDFWTFCCINCMHVLDELREIEHKYADTVVIVGVHSPKFPHEADPRAIASAIDRHHIGHPVLNDAQLQTWTEFGARAWPTLVLIDPEGYIVATMAGEGHGAHLMSMIDDLIVEHDKRGTLVRSDGPFVAPTPRDALLHHPGGFTRLPSGNLLIADTGAHVLRVMSPDGDRVEQTFGADGEPGLSDGVEGAVRFQEPNGVTLLPEDVSARLGYDVVVADTANHAVRGLNTSSGEVVTILSPESQVQGIRASAVLPTSPWDVVWDPVLKALVVAMAGIHQIWVIDPNAGQRVRDRWGTCSEGLVDGPLRQAWFAQTSGLSLGIDGLLWIVDSETSSLRVIDRDRTRVTTVIGAGLFEFGDLDGPASHARMQHPLGLCALPDGDVLIADTYNGAVRRYLHEVDAVTTVADGLDEPTGVLLDDHSDLLVLESDRVTIHPLADGAGNAVGSIATSSNRPPMDVAAKDVELDIPFTLPPGHKIDDSFGDPTWLEVSATPPELLVEGGGSGSTLSRTLTFSKDVGQGVLHVTARAASCDADPEVENPACYIHRQEWGIPIRVIDGAEHYVRLPLLG